MQPTQPTTNNDFTLSVTCDGVQLGCKAHGKGAEPIETSYAAFIHSRHSAPKAQYLVGLLASFALLFPLLGRVTILGDIPARVFAVPSMLLCLWMLLIYGLWGNSRHIITGTIVLLVFLVLWHSDSWQYASLLSLSIGSDYYSSKLIRFAIQSIPPIVLFLFVSGLSNSPRFVTGICHGTIGLSIFAFINLINLRMFFLYADTFTAQDFQDHQYFSTIQFSALITAGCLSVMCTKPKTIMIQVMKFILMACMLIAVVLLRQRAHLIFIAGAMLIATALTRGVRFRSFTIMIGSVVVVVVAFTMFAGTAVTDYWVRLYYGDGIDIRKELFSTAISEGIRNWEGHGFGAYSLIDNFFNYPHNIFAEAFYELGIFGATLILFLICYGFAQLPRLTDPYIPEMPFHPAVIVWLMLFFLLHSLKAGDFTSSLYYFVCFLIITPSRLHPQTLHPNVYTTHATL